MKSGSCVQETVKKSGHQFIHRSKNFRAMFTREYILSRQIFILKISDEIESGSQETGNSEKDNPTAVNLTIFYCI